jgi:hypothetical protein
MSDQLESAPARRLDWRDDRGQLAGIEALPFGLLIFVIGALLITNAWAVVDTKIAVDAAAREAVRAYVEAPDEATARVAASTAADDTITGHGRRADHLKLLVTHEGGQPFARCVRVTAEAAYAVPALRLPWIGGLGHAFDVRAHHTERIDPYRSGLAGTAAC